MFATLTRFDKQSAQRRQERRVYRNLHALDDRMLKDIGIDRAYVAMVTAGIDYPRRRQA